MLSVDEDEQETVEDDVPDDADMGMGGMGGMDIEKMMAQMGEADEEAEKIYQAVDEAMDLRRRARREAQEQAELAKLRAQRPKIQQQNKTEFENALDERQQLASGFGSSLDNGALTNFVEIGQAPDKILSPKLDQISGTQSTLNGTSTSVDPKGYLTSLDSVGIKSSAEIGDIKRARMLFDSLVKLNPKYAPGWIAAACLEEHAGTMVAARKIIKQGCEHCPKSEDVWLEAARSHNKEDGKIVLANAVQHVGQSVKIWLAAADLEHDLKAKKRVLRKELLREEDRLDTWVSDVETVEAKGRVAVARAILAFALKAYPDKRSLWRRVAELENAHGMSLENLWTNDDNFVLICPTQNSMAGREL
ncbi:hypothetical protein D9613_012962 [Agrocybe pediades]|uniref:PRP1 splicing factor N-terminal domain-containing protein n=1 Tax=Agrocybe pediades TaxID=84607 RepID=A0A8H4QWJ6_9AGAR|nr:hypothetical protein D9613_012962 [Agrocybe pediades]